jgi:hypothetical protein
MNQNKFSSIPANDRSKQEVKNDKSINAIKSLTHKKIKVSVLQFPSFASQLNELCLSQQFAH